MKDTLKLDLLLLGTIVSRFMRFFNWFSAHRRLYPCIASNIYVPINNFWRTKYVTIMAAQHLSRC